MGGLKIEGPLYWGVLTGHSKPIPATGPREDIDNTVHLQVKKTQGNSLDVMYSGQLHFVNTPQTLE